MESSTFQIKDGILIANYSQKLEVDLELAKQLVASRLAYQNGMDYPIVIHLNGIKTSSKEARMYMATNGIKGITIGAFIVSNMIEKVILNFFLSVEKPPVPVKAFTQEEDAVKWIHEVKAKA